MVFSSVCCDRTRGNCFKLKRVNQFIVDIGKTYKKGDNTLKEFAQRYGRCPITGNIQGQTECGMLAGIEDH